VAHGAFSQPGPWRPAAGYRLARTLGRMNLTAPALQLRLSPRRRADDEDWCRVQVVASAGGFTADFEAWLQTTDLERFARGLDAMHRRVGAPGTATLSSAEPDIYLELSMQRLGGIAGKYKLQAEAEAGGSSALSGSFEADQSFLPALCESVRTLIAQLRHSNAA